MDRDNSNISSYNHSISLLERKTLVITGVKKIENFDNLHFLLETTLGYMMVKGDSLELIKLDTLSSNVTIKGNINNIDYLLDHKETKKEDSLLSKLFK